jgi:hypothetical protein
VNVGLLVVFVIVPGLVEPAFDLDIMVAAEQPPLALKRSLFRAEDCGPRMGLIAPMRTL